MVESLATDLNCYLCLEDSYCFNYLVDYHDLEGYLYGSKIQSSAHFLGQQGMEALNYNH